MKVCPAIVTDPVRPVVTVFAATVSPTVPFPLPLAPELTVIHVAPLVADQTQPVVVVTPTVALPPPARIDVPADEML